VCTIRNRCALASALVAVLACAPAATQSGASSLTSSSISLTVTNQNWLDVVVYAIRGMTRVRIGNVTGNMSAQLKIPESLIVAGQVQLMADPIGSTERYVSDPINVAPDERVQLTVAPALKMSSYAVLIR
jgi:hypothetical protein